MEINIDADDIVPSLSRREKREVFKALQDDPDILTYKERMELEEQERREQDEYLMRELGSMAPFELKKILCNLLCVGSYSDDQALRERLEPVITAR